MRLRVGMAVGFIVAGALSGGTATAADLGPLGGDVLRPSLQEAVVPLDEIRWSFEARYWHSTGKTTWNHDASRVDPRLGNPTSRLDYDHLPGRTGEIEIRGDEATGLFGRAMIGFGPMDGGTFRDRDWFAGQVRFSDTISRVRDGAVAYAAVDGGSVVPGLSAGPLVTSLFAGYGYWGEKAPGVGIRCLPDDVGNSICPLGDALPPDAKAVSNHVHWHMLRVGIEGRVQVGSMLTLSGEVAAVPIALLVNDDFHHNRWDLGPTPNVLHEGAGFGIQTQALATLHLTPDWSIGVGARYWHMETYEGSASVRNGGKYGPSFPVNRFASDRYGLLATSGLQF